MEKLNPKGPVIDNLQKHVDQFEEARLIEKEQLLMTLNIMFGPEVVAGYLERESNPGGANISQLSPFREYLNQSKN